MILKNYKSKQPNDQKQLKLDRNLMKAHNNHDVQDFELQKTNAYFGNSSI